MIVLNVISRQARACIIIIRVWFIPQCTLKELNIMFSKLLIKLFAKTMTSIIDKLLEKAAMCVRTNNTIQLVYIIS